MMKIISIAAIFIFSIFGVQGQTFQKLIGNTNDNRFGKAIFYNNNYYVLGKNDLKATVTKLDINGNHVWSNETNEEANWSDIIVNKDSNLMVVGSFGPATATVDNHCLGAVINISSGAFIILRTYNLGFRELFFKILENPVPANSNFPYYVTGSKTPSVGNLDDDFMILNFDNNFNLREGRTYSSGFDDQLFRDIFLAGQNGAFMNIGNKNSINGFKGSTILLDKNMGIISKRNFNQAINFTTGLSFPNPIAGFYQILAGSTTSGTQEAVLLRVNENSLTYTYKIPFLKVINKLSIGNSNDLYAIGVATIGSVDKTIVLNLQENGTSLTLNWAKILDQSETAFANGYINYDFASNRLLYTDSRNGNPQGHGSFDGLICVENSNLDNCMDDSLTVILNDNQMIIDTFPMSFTSFYEPQSINRTGTTLAYQSSMPCSPPCTLEATATYANNNNCGSVTFTANPAGGTPPYIYSWNIGCNSTIEGSSNPLVVTIGHGTQPYCVTITDANMCEVVLNNLTVVGINDIIPPVITCPQTISISCTEDINDLTLTGNAYATDNIDPSPTISIVSTTLTSSTNCAKSFQRVFSATDACGSQNWCDQVITVIDNTVPVLVGCGRKIIAQGIRNSDGICQSDVVLGTPSVFDQCDLDAMLINSYTLTGNASGTYPVGQTIVNWTAKDDCGLMSMCQDTVIVLNCSDCCWDKYAFDELTETVPQIRRENCTAQISILGLTACQRVRIDWGDGTISGYLTTPAVFDHNYTVSGDYQACALYEEIAADSTVCYSETVCYDICVECGPECEEVSLVNSCHTIPGITLTEDRYAVNKFDMIHAKGKVYTVSGLLNGLTGMDAAIIEMSEDCGIVTKYFFGGDGDEVASVIKYDPTHDQFIITGIFNTPNWTPTGNPPSYSPLTNTGTQFSGFVMAINASTFAVKWAFSIGNQGRSAIYDVDVDDTGNVYIVGTAYWGNIDFDPEIILNPLAVENLPNSSGFVAKYSPTGAYIWHELFEPSDNAHVSISAIEVVGNKIFIGGGMAVNSILAPSATLILSAGATPLSLTVNAPTNTWSASFLVQLEDGIFPTRTCSEIIIPQSNSINGVTDIESDGTNLYVSGHQFFNKYILPSATTTCLTLVCHYPTDYHLYNIDLSSEKIFLAGSNPKPQAMIDFVGSTFGINSFDWEMITTILDKADCSYQKSMVLSGSNLDYNFGLLALPNDNFYIHGVTRSYDFKYSPVTPSPILSAPHVPNESTVLIGKYSCECTEEIDCCAETSATLSGPDLCCKTIDLINQADFHVTHIGVEVITPGWDFGPSTIGTGYNVTSSGSEYIIQHASGLIPVGNINGIIDFCLAGTGTIPSTQQIVVRWYETSISGNMLVVCSDTLDMFCDPPPQPIECLDFNLISVVCDPDDDLSYLMNFTITNLTSNVNATSVYLSGLPSGFYFESCGGGGLVTNINVPIGPPIGPGQTSSTLCVKINSSSGILSPEDVCFDLQLKGLDGNIFTCCNGSEPECISIQPCCDPCEEILFSVEPLADNPDGCCYSLIMNNSCQFDYFTKMEVQITTADVHFGYINASTGWSNCATPTQQQLCIQPNSGIFPIGNHVPALGFCLTNINDASQVPQDIVISLYSTNDLGVEFIACAKVLQLACDTIPNDSCLIVTNATVFCDQENEKYQVSVTIENNSNPDFCANEVVITPLNPGLVMPSVIVLPDFLCHGESTTINFMITNLPFPDADGMFELLFSLKNNLSEECCQGGVAHIDTILLPDCPCATTCCEDLPEHDFESYSLGNLPNTQIGWQDISGIPSVVSGGVGGSANCVLLPAHSRGLMPSSIEYRHAGVAGPDVILPENSLICLKFRAKLNPILTLPVNGFLTIQFDHTTVHSLTIPYTNSAWTYYELCLITPPGGVYTLQFINNSAAPLDIGPSIQIDDICFKEKVQIFNDLTPPVILCPNDITLQDADTDCIIDYIIPNLSVSDPSGVEFVEYYLDGYSVVAGSTHPLDNSIIHEVVCIAADVCNNMDTCVYTISVQCDTTQCICPTNITPFTITQGLDRIDVSCGEMDTLDCPISDVFINGTIKCQSSDPGIPCAPNSVTWTLDRPILADMNGTSGSSVSFLLIASDVSDPGIYTLTLSTICPDSPVPCICVISWFQPDCDPNTFCPGNIVQNGDFEMGDPSGNYDDINMATGWSGIWGTNGWETGEYLNTGTTPPTFPHPLPLTQNGYAGFWLDKSGDNNKREGIMNQLASSIMPGTGCYSMEFKIACLGAQYNTPVLEIYGVSIGAVATIVPITQTTPLNSSLFTPPPILLGDFSVNTGTCNNNFVTINIDFDSNILTSGIDRIFFTRSDLPVLGSRGAFIAMDDVCLTSTSCDFVCTCPPASTIFTIKDGNSTYTTSCSTPTSPVPTLDCPVNDLTITGNYGCVSSDQNTSCPTTIIQWTLDRPTGGNLTGFITGPNLNITLSALDVSAPGMYSLTVNTDCEGDTCSCIINWLQIECDTCCKDESSFIVNTQNAVTASYDPSTCVASVDIALLSACIKIDQINWGDGNIVNGPLNTGLSYNHSFSTNGTYLVSTIFSEYNANGIKCWSKKVENRMTINCNSQCLCSPGFNNMTINGTKIDCNSTNTIDCPIKNRIIISGGIRCSPTNCGPNSMKYKLFNSANTLLVQGNITGATFNLLLLAGWFDQAGGDYYFVFEAYCGSNLCSCRINLKVPPCPKDCLCNSNFSAEVSLGFNVDIFTPLLPCRYQFTPRNLCPRDRVTWLYNGTAFGTTPGTNSIVFNSSNVSPNEICMKVDRIDINGVKCTEMFCRVLKRCNSLPSTPLCSYPFNNSFNNGKIGILNDVGDISSWVLIRGEAYAESEEDNSNHIMMVSKKEINADLLQVCCVDSPNKNLNYFSLVVRNDGFEKIPKGTKLQLFSPSDVTVPEYDELKAEIELDNVGFDWTEVKASSFSDPSWESNNLVLRLFNPGIEPVYLSIDDLCLDFVSRTGEQNNSKDFNIHPNPTKGELTLSFNQPFDSEIYAEVLDLLGNVVKKYKLNAGIDRYVIDLFDLPSTLYFIKLTERNGNSVQKKIIKIE